MKIALAQTNSTVGDLRGNAELIRRAVADARAAGADLVALPELVVCGYPPKDLLLREDFVSACDRLVRELASSLDPDIGVILGHPTHWNVPPGRIANAASLLHEGRVQATTHKVLLPNYDVFDECRYFRAGESPRPVEFGGKQIGLHICEDAWWREPGTFHHNESGTPIDPVAALAEAGADVLLDISASPFELAKPHRRTEIVARHVARHGLPYLFVNQVGGNDDLVFDGYGFAVDAGGQVVVRMAGFREDFRLIDLDALPAPVAADEAESERSRESDLLDALILGLRDYMRKCGFTDCVFGLSGGIDSTLAAYIAAQAAGPERVHALLMPSRYSSDHSLSDSLRLVENLGIDHSIIPIDGVHRAYEETPIVSGDLSAEEGSLADQNLQARIRGAIVMTRSNRHGWLALATGNKSELAVGYCTLYGDMVGGFAVLSDVLKRDVYAASRYVNEVRERREAIPWAIIDKPPSAELAPDQFDQDTLPPYPLLDAVLEGLIERDASVRSLCARFPPETVRWIAARLDRNEFKRRQLPPGIKLSPRAFGSGRRMPIAARTTTDDC